MQNEIYNEHLNNINKIGKYKKTEHDGTQNRHKHYWKIEQHFYRRMQNGHEHDWKTEQYFYSGTQNRHEKYKKLNGTTMTEHKTDMNLTKLDKYKKTEHDGTQNRYEHY